MSSLSQRNSGQEFAQPPVSAYILAYGLWLFTFLFGLLVAFALRDLSQMAMLFTTWDRYVVHLVNQVGVVVFVVLLLILLVATEAYYRHGASRRQLWPRFARMIGLLALILTVAQVARLALEVAAGAVNLLSVLILAVALVVYGWTRTVAGQQHTAATSAPTGWLTARVVIVTTLLAGAALIALPIKYPINPYDEGLALVNGMRVLRGDVPFRDYWAIYPPGQSYVLATLFSVVGETVLVERVYDTIVRILLALVLYGIAVQMLRSWRWALAPYLAAATLLAAATFYGYAVFPALLFGFAALLLSFRFLDTGVRRWLWGAGLLAGVTSFFRLDLAFYTAAALGVLLLLHWLFLADAVGGWSGRARRFLSALLVTAGPAMLAAMLFYGYLGSVAGVALLVENLLIFPATTFRAVRHLPYPALAPDWALLSGDGGLDNRLNRMLGDYLRFYIPLLVYAWCAGIMLWRGVRALRSGLHYRRTDAMTAALIVMGGGLFVQALSRYDEIHVLPASLVTVVLITWLVRQIPAARWQQPWVAAPVAVLLLAPVLLYFYSPYSEVNDIVRAYPPQGCFSTLPRAGCAPTLSGQDEVVQILDRQAPMSAPLFAGLPRHDNVFANDVSIYFLAGRPIATRYHELHPGVTTTQPVQEEMVAELAAAQPPWLVLITWGNPNEPNASRFSSGVTLLDDYIRTHYRRELTTGMYELWQRR